MKLSRTLQLKRRQALLQPSLLDQTARLIATFEQRPDSA